MPIEEQQWTPINDDVTNGTILVFTPKADGVLHITTAFSNARDKAQNNNPPFADLWGYINGHESKHAQDSRFENTTLVWNVDLPLTQGSTVTIATKRRNMFAHATGFEHHIIFEY